MLPGDRRAVGHCLQERFSTGGVLAVFQLLRQIEIVPADDAVLDEPLACFRHFLFFFLRLQKLARIAHRDGAREAVHVLNAIELLFDRLPQRRIVDQAENK